MRDHEKDIQSEVGAPGVGGVSRREFLKGSGALAAATAMGTATLEQAEARAAESARVVGPEAVPIMLVINGKSQPLRLEPRVTLLDALRNHLDLTGAKKVCDRATCGSCTVLMDGKPVYACSVLAIEAQGKKITTVEGLGTPNSMHAVQSAFVHNDAQQCGFCTPGFVVATAAFVQKHPSCTLDEVRKGLGGNLCRCGTYVGVMQAALDAAKMMKGGAANG